MQNNNLLTFFLDTRVRVTNSILSAQSRVEHFTPVSSDLSSDVNKDWTYKDKDKD